MWDLPRGGPTCEICPGNLCLTPSRGGRAAAPRWAPDPGASPPLWVLDLAGISSSWMAPEEPSCPSPSPPRQHRGSEPHLGVPKHAAATRLDGEGGASHPAQTEGDGANPSEKTRWKQRSWPKHTHLGFPLLCCDKGPPPRMGLFVLPGVTRWCEPMLKIALPLRLSAEKRNKQTNNKKQMHFRK